MRVHARRQALHEIFHLDCGGEQRRGGGRARLLLRDVGGVPLGSPCRLEMRRKHVADLVEIKERLADHGELLRREAG